MPGTMNIGSLILQMILSGEIVIRGQMNQVTGPSGGSNFAKCSGQGRAVADIDMHPGDVRMYGSAAFVLRSPGQGKYAVLAFQFIEKVSPHSGGWSRRRMPSCSRTRSQSAAIEMTARGWQACYNLAGGFAVGGLEAGIALRLVVEAIKDATPAAEQAISKFHSVNHCMRGRFRSVSEQWASMPK